MSNQAIPFQARQGDVLLIQVDSLPKEIERLDHEGEAVVLARGEATGHAHVLEGAAVHLHEQTGGGRFVTVGEEGATLRHEQHREIRVQKGTYIVRRQREYDGRGARDVTD